jgi:hypothetical protein
MKKLCAVFAAYSFLFLTFTQVAQSWQAAVEVVSKIEKIPKNFKT